MGFGAGGTNQYGVGGQSVLPGEQNGGTYTGKTPDFSMGIGIDPALVNQFLQGLADTLKGSGATTDSSGLSSKTDWEAVNKTSGTGGFYG